jgi:hypothetical protein
MGNLSNLKSIKNAGPGGNRGLKEKQGKAKEKQRKSSGKKPGKKPGRGGSARYGLISGYFTL